MEKLIRKILKETTTTKAGFKAFDNVVNMYMKKNILGGLILKQADFHIQNIVL